MIIDSPLEVKLYKRETIELPGLITGLLPKVKGVYQPESADDIERLFSCSKEKKLSIIPRGAATSGIGAITPLRQSLMVDLTLLHKILDINEKKKTVYLEAGSRWWELKQCLKKFSLDLYTYPTSLFSTVGGWLSTGGYGVNSFKYGHVTNAVEAIEVVTPSMKKVINREDPQFKYFIGTEGQMGIISKVKLRVRELRPPKSHLVFFKTPLHAQEFLLDLVKSKNSSPLNISYFDRLRLEHKNHLLKGKVSFPRMEGILTVFEDSTSEEAFFKLVERRKGVLAEEYLTAFLWNERFFPFSVKQFYPSLLGCEAILPIENLSTYTAHTREFGRSFGLSLSTEATLINEREAVVFTLFPSDPKKILHFFHLLLTYSLTRVALKSGGIPYGIGIWNLPLLKKKYSLQELKEYSRFKKELDPSELINTAKSFSDNHLITHFLKFAYQSSALFSHRNPLLKDILKIISTKSNKTENSVSEADACANCGACTVVCPAYLMRRNEIVTAKGKLFLLKQLINGAPVSKHISEKVFFCLHCRLCEQVCQSKLSLIPLWERLESLVEKTYGRPQEKIDEFIKEVDQRPDYSNLLDMFSLSPNDNHEEQKDV